MSRAVDTDAISDGDLFVAPDGDDDWSGQRASPADDGSDGPFATVARAQEAVRERKADAEPLPQTVWLRGGRYPVTEPLTFGPEDSAPVTYAAYPGERPVIDGGRAIDGWEETTVDGVDVWKTTVSRVADGEWYFRQLFVNGQRRRRPRLPAEGYYEIADVPYDRDELWNVEGCAYAFTTDDAPLDQWNNLEDVDALVPHRWVQERSPLTEVDPDAGRVETAFYAKMWLQGDERLAFENVFEALSEPGEWYLDRETGECYYVPVDGEDPATAEVYAPEPAQLLRVEGDPTTGDEIEFLGFHGITFRHAAWEYPARFDDDRLQAPAHRLHRDDDAATSVQAQFILPGAISLSGAQNCRIEACTVEHVGLYGLQLAQGCRSIRVVDNEVSDTGAGGLKVEGETLDGPRERRTGDNRVTDNLVHACGRVFPAGVGVLARHTFGNTISHNHIHDLYYSGISCGWSWGFDPCVDRDNRIEYNHIHDVGQGLLSDMGGIYTLGVQPGTKVRGNHVHDVACYDYGGWAIYTDEGSSHIVVEDNVCHDTNRQTFHQHYGRENIVRNNVFAHGAEGGVALSRTDEEQGQGFTFERNVVVTDGEPLFLGGYGADLDAEDLTSDLNLFWDRSGDDPTFAVPDRDSETGTGRDRQEWAAAGHDRHSSVADPEFADPASGDFSLSEDSPPSEVGFEPIDCSDVGPRR